MKKIDATVFVFCSIRYAWPLEIIPQVCAAVDVGVDLLVVPVQSIEDLPGLLGGGAGVQVDNGVTVHLARQEGEVGLDGGGVHGSGGHGGGRFSPLRWTRWP